MRLRLKIKTLLTLIFIGVYLPILTLAIVSIMHVSEMKQAMIKDEISDLNNKIVNATQDRLSVATQALEVLGNTKSARQGDWKQLYQDAKRLIASNPHYVAITLVDQENNRQFATSLPYGSRTFEPRYTELVQEALLTGKSNVSGPFTVPVTDGYKIAVSSPFRSNDSGSHVLRMILNVDSIG